MYWNLEQVQINNPKSIQNRLGALFIISGNLFMMYFNTALSIFIFEKVILAKEFQSGYYELISYYMSKLIVELPIIAMFPIMLSSIVYFNLNFDKQISKFLLFCFACVLETWLGTSMGIVLACLNSRWERAVQISPLIFIILLLYAGYTINLENVWIYLRFLQYLSPVKYTFEFLVFNEFQDYDYLGKSNPIQTLNFVLGIKKTALLNIAFLILYLILGFFALKFKLKKLQN